MIVLTILTYNASATIDALLQSVFKQTLKPDVVLLIDSCSTDDTIAKAKKFPVQIHTIQKSEFNHGKTRRFATELVPAGFYIFLTQDALPASNDAFENLLKAFDDEKVGCAYGRQIPNKDANPLAAHARLFNYPEISSVKQYSDRFKYGIKTCFNSDSFAAYRKEALEKVGGFPEKIILGEDVVVAAKMLQQGWKIAYQADAKVYHSHNYSIMQEFKRYFDIGVFHATNKWILDAFNSPTGEGLRYVKSELIFCLKIQKYSSLVKSVLSCGFKFLGYKLGRHFTIIPKKYRGRFSMHNLHW